MMCRILKVNPSPLSIQKNGLFMVDLFSLSVIIYECLKVDLIGRPISQCFM